MEQKKIYLTKERLKSLREELEELKKERKKRTEGESPEALHSEELNPDYIAFKEKINLLDAKIAKLEEVVKNARVLRAPRDKSKVEVGAKVTVEVEGKKDHFTIVSSMEADPALGRISDQSPVGRALLGKRVGEEVPVSSPIKTIYKIKEVNY